MSNLKPVLTQTNAKGVVLAADNLVLGSDGFHYLQGLQGPPGPSGSDSLSTHTVERITEVRYVNVPEVRYVERVVPVAVISTGVAAGAGTAPVARAAVGEPAISPGMVTKAVSDWLTGKEPMEVFKLTSSPELLKYRPQVVEVKTDGWWNEGERAKARVKVVRN